VVVNETIKVAAKLGCASPGQDMKKCMQSKTIEEIMDATSNNGTVRSWIKNILNNIH
jgi:hypothetical protein